MMLIIDRWKCGKDVLWRLFFHRLGRGFRQVINRRRKGRKQFFLGVFRIVFYGVFNRGAFAALRFGGQNGGKGCEKWGEKRWISTPFFRGGRGGVFLRLWASFQQGYEPVFHSFLNDCYWQTKKFLWSRKFFYFT